MFRAGTIPRVRKSKHVEVKDKMKDDRKVFSEEQLKAETKPLLKVRPHLRR
jgi:hypothetical protein